MQSRLLSLIDLEVLALDVCLYKYVHIFIDLFIMLKGVLHGFKFYN